MKAYAEIRGHGPDFIVEYSLIPHDQGGRKRTYQHLRCDFHYEGDDLEKDGIYMIWPEFLDEQGNPIPHEVQVPLRGKASMWIVAPEMRNQIHRHRISVGTVGFLMEGSRKIGRVTISKVVGLHGNPTE